MLIVLEGLDGAGKSTQVSLLKEYITKRCGSLEYIHFPRYESPVYGDLISRFLRGDFGSIDSVHPQLVALLFAEDRHGAAVQIRRALSEGKTVLLDRYVYSNIAYQCAKLKDEQEAEALRKWILRTEYVDFAEPKPDLNIFLHVPIDFVENSLNSSRTGSDKDYLGDMCRDIHESDINFQKRVNAMYMRQAAEDPSFIGIDCSDENGKMLPAADIFEKIKNVVSSVL